ncbi:MAG: hypothetical protein A2Y17_00850 [Clostridiales bacterium GWF2_38_85]|nr:MAG: hypothetical protein A2Y17_00850 [Clostridiales bacterium GWF2_38_85]HBL84559.1 DUF1015 domain-containing protein [Clostridiales bacterium]
MATIKPFRPLRYTEKCGQISDAVSPPYDIISPEERVNLVNRSKYNIVQLELPEGGDDKYKNAAALLNEWVGKGVLAEDEKEGFFVYSETFTVKQKEYTVYGMLCRVKLCDFSEKIILPHEETLTKAKTDRFNLMGKTFCNFSPIYSLYIDEARAVPSILVRVMQSESEIAFTDDGAVTHRLWKISDASDIRAIQNAMADKQLFIADGHHRYETALNFRNKLREQDKFDETSADYQMMMLVDMDNDGLVIFPTHRLVNPPEDITADELLQKCSDSFEITEYDDINTVEAELEKYNKVTAFALYDGKKGFSLLILKDKNAMKTILPQKSDAYRGLNVSVLHTLILDKLLGIDADNMALGKSLTYTRDIDFAITCVKNGNAKFAFILNSTRIHEIKDISLAGEKMPQKSTYFYPKLITGLTINNLLTK